MVLCHSSHGLEMVVGFWEAFATSLRNMTMGKHGGYQKGTIQILQILMISMYSLNNMHIHILYTLRAY